MRRLLSVAEATGQLAAPAFNLDNAWHLHPQVALRDEAFGALAYHYGTRRLTFLKSRTLVALVTALAEHPSAGAAINAVVPKGERTLYGRALANLAASGVIDAD